MPDGALTRRRHFALPRPWADTAFTRPRRLPRRCLGGDHERSSRAARATYGENV